MTNRIWRRSMAHPKKIVQETFDNAVRENIEEFDMELEEAVSDAKHQFGSQGVDLSNIATSYYIADDGGLMLRQSVKDAVDNIKDLLLKEPLSDEKLLDSLKQLSLEFSKDQSNRTLARNHGAANVLLSTCKRCVDNEDLFTASMDAFCAFVQGQGDVVNCETIQFLLQCLKEFKQREKLTRLLVQAIRLSCIKSEGNRQTFVQGDIIPTLFDILKMHTQSISIIKEACAVLRVLTFDDDMSVPFGKAHEHAKLIVAESAIPILLEMLDAHQQQVEVASELLATLGRLAVKEEFCKEIVDLGGLKIILQILQDNISHQAIAKQACTVLRAIAGSDQVKVSIVKAGGLELIVAAMTTHAKQSAVAEQGCAALGAIALRSPSNCVAIVTAGGADTIVQVMHIHPDAIGVQKQACLAIRNLVGRNPEHREVVLELGAEALIQRAQQRFADCADLAKGALRDLGCDVELRELWTGTGHSGVAR